jgi:twitching motility protein PilT
MTIPEVISTEAIIAASEIQDWHLSVTKPLESVVFPNMRPVPENLQEFVIGLAAEVVRMFANHTDKTASVLVCFCNLIYRTHAINGRRYALRLMRNDVPVFGKDVKMRRDISEVLMSAELKRTGGLIVISGAPGTGKSWSLASIVIARLKELGGYALSIEDPIEIEAMEGWHYGLNNKGYCEQMTAPSKKEGGYSAAIESSLRCFPAGERAMLSVGEVRDADTAAEVLRIALAGHLVFTTVHSMDHFAAIDRMIVLATHSGEPRAAAMLANTLRLSIHQRLDNGSLSATVLKSNPAIRNGIEKCEYGPLKTILESQNSLAIPKAPPTTPSGGKQSQFNQPSNNPVASNEAPAMK